jgi:hypothetical protein
MDSKINIYHISGITLTRRDQLVEKKLPQMPKYSDPLEEIGKPRPIKTDETTVPQADRSVIRPIATLGSSRVVIDGIEIDLTGGGRH